MRMRITTLSMMAGLMLAVVAAYSAHAEQAAQELPTATPAQVDLFNVAPEAVEQLGEETATPTRTPTPLGPVQIEAKEMANVRAQPDQDSERLGEIRAGEYYNVIRRYYRWIEFQYDPAPNRRGWVFDELVNIIGDESAILVVDSLDATLPAEQDLGVTATGLAVTQTPGGLLTATAVARQGGGTPVVQIGIVAPGNPNLAEITAEAEVRDALPTFTYPPGILALAPTEATEEAQAAPTDSIFNTRRGLDAPFPPIVPIIALGGLGLLGLLIGAIRR